MKSPLINKFRSQLQALEQEVLQHDKKLRSEQQKLIQDLERFNHELFIQHGAKLQPCIQQLAKNINDIEKQLTLNMPIETIQYSCERYQNRFTAVKRALSSTGVNIKDARQQKASKKAFWANRQNNQHQSSGFEWIASSVMQNSHQLYDELNKHLNWATRIEQKIAELELNLEKANSRNKITLQNDILSMHRRLGKCRQAITYIEERIQLFERPNFRTR